MSNHLHLVIRSDPQRVTEWTADTVARRWAMAHPRIGADGHPVAWSEPDLAARAADAAWVAKIRTRLRSLSWFMKSIKERLARRANRADRCTGHFWEGRFQWRLWTGDYGQVIATLCGVLVATAAHASRPSALIHGPCVGS